MPKARLRWNYFKDRLIESFGGIVYKIGVDAGFTCPNRDGVKAFGGCAYCSQEGSLSPHQDPNLAIKDQITKGMSFVKRRYGAENYIVYFQSFTNTYDKPEVLHSRYSSALVDDKIVGLSIATRPDCILPENIEVLREFKEKSKYFSVELGLQSAHQNTLDWVNRQENTEDYLRAMKLLRDAEIPVITHVILGFPGESEQEMIETVELAELEGTAGIKLQMLHVIKNTKLAVFYHRKPFELYTMEQYGEVLIDLVERLSPKVEIHRITGETESSQLVAPEWVNHKTAFFNYFENELEKRNTWQGKRHRTRDYCEAIPCFNQSSFIKK
jgi:radical SAM protein (TIGR01212 family)